MRIVSGSGVTLRGFDLLGVDEFGVSWNVNAIEDWDAPPGNTAEVVQNEFADGGWLTPGYREPKTVRLVGRLVAPDRPAARAAIYRLSQVIPSVDTAIVAVAEDGVVTRRWMKLEGAPKIPRPTDVYASFDLLLTAPDSRLFSGDGSTPYQFQATAFLPSATGGLQLLGAEVLRTNLCTNPGAEVDTAGWSTNQATLTSDSSWESSGTKSFKVVPAGGASSDMRAGSPVIFPMGMQPGKTYRVSATGRLAAPQISGSDTRARRVSLLYSINGVSYTTVSGSQGPNVAGTFRSSALVELPANATGALIMLGAGSANAADAIWWDDILVEETSADLSYFDGSTPATSSRTYAWVGPVGGSASTESSVGGLQVPFSIGATVVNGSVTVTASGDAPPLVLVRINGPAVQPIIRDELGGSMPLDISLDTGQWLDVDLDNRTIRINSTVSRRNLLRGPWITPRAGMVLSLDAAVYDPITSMTVFWTDASY